MASDSVLGAAHAALGATLAEVAGVQLPRSYGDTAAEYAAARGAAAVVDRADLAVVRLWGRDPVKMVQGLITGDLAGAPEGQAVYAGVLTPKGKMIAELRALRLPGADGPEVLLLMPREALDGMRAHLAKYVPPMFARWADASAEIGVVGVYGPRAAELVGRVLAAEVGGEGEDRFRTLPFGTERVTALETRDVGAEPGFDLLAATAALPALWDALLAQGGDLGARPVGHAALETLRIEAGRPRYGRDMDEDTIPTEAWESTGLLQRGISFTKGCYTGQEVIVRIAHRGHVNRHLRGILLGEHPTPASRTPLFHPESGKQVGWTTSATVSPRAGQTIALAYLRREVEPGQVVRLGEQSGPEARVSGLPF